MNNLPIGIFDSGIGGLSITKEVIRLLPNESTIYLGDTARVPYGVRGKATIINFSQELTNFLLKKKVKALVVACNTMSAVSLMEIRKIAGQIPVIDVISPTISFALGRTHTNTLGVIGTRATINSRAYEAHVKSENEASVIFSIACPLFVPLVEEGMINDPATQLIANEYLSEFDNKNIDTLILGCTHYPLLRNVIARAINKNIVLVDPAIPTAVKLTEVLKHENILNASASSGVSRKFYVTDAPDRVYDIANLFFDGNFPGSFEKVTL